MNGMAFDLIFAGLKQVHADGNRLHWLIAVAFIVVASKHRDAPHRSQHTSILFTSFTAVCFL